MNIVPEKEYVSPDGELRFVIIRDDNGDVSLGFDGFGWHTHGDLLASLLEIDEQRAISQYVGNLINDHSVIARSIVDGAIRDIWITDDPSYDLEYIPDGERIELRYWSGRPYKRVEE